MSRGERKAKAQESVNQRTSARLSSVGSHLASDQKLNTQNLLTNTKNHDIMVTQERGRKTPQTRKGFIMKNTMTRVDALNYAIAAVTYSTDVLTDSDEITDVLIKIRDQIAKPRKTSDEAKAKAKAKRADARSALMAQVLPILREVITTDMTAKEIFTAAQERLPQDFTVNKVQAILLREMKNEVIKTETKGKANTYRLAE